MWLDGSYGEWGLRRRCIRRGFHGGVVRYAGVGNTVVSGGEWEHGGQWGGMGGKIRERRTTMKVVVHFSLRTVRLQIPGSPLMYLLPQSLRRANMNRPHPFGKGRGGYGYVLASEVSCVVIGWAHIPQQMGEALSESLHEVET